MSDDDLYDHESDLNFMIRMHQYNRADYHQDEEPENRDDYMADEDEEGDYDDQEDDVEDDLS